MSGDVQVYQVHMCWSYTLKTVFAYFYIQCVPPYVGDGSLCVLDSDGDSYPALALRTCSDGDTETYCTQDTCPTAPNPDQSDTSPCSGTAQTGTWNMYFNHSPDGLFECYADIFSFALT